MINEPFYEAKLVAAGPVTAPLFTWMEVGELFPNPSSKVESLLNIITKKEWEAKTALYDEKYFFRLENVNHRFTVVILQKEFEESKLDLLAEVIYRLLISLENLPL